MGVLADFWTGLPKIVQVIFAVSVFLFAGSTILQVIVIIWNLLGVNVINAINGCFAGNPEVCIPEQDGIYIFGINFADYWTILVLVMLMPLAFFAIKWYSLMLPKNNT